MSEYRLSREERETIIVMNEAENTMEITTWSQPMVRKVRTIAASHGAEVEEINYEGVRATLPKKALTLRKPVRQSEEQKRASAERLRSLQTGGQKQNVPTEMTQEP